MLDAPWVGRGLAGALSLCALVACGGGEAGGPLPDATAVRDAATTDAAPVERDATPVPRPDAAASDAATPADAPPLGPPYPVVLAHGFFGFEELGGSFLTYFYGVRDALAERGELDVHTPAVDPFNDSATRGEALAEAVDAILAASGHDKVVLIGHSQGGLDARYVASTRPEQVAAVVTISTPHRGTPMIDLVLRAAEDERLREWLDGIVRIVGRPLWDAAGDETSFFRALEQLSESGSEAFNAAYPDDPGVAYYSLAGRSDRNLAVAACATDEAPSFVTRHALERDPIDPLLAASEAFMDGGFGDPEPNDGMVRISSARWGTFLGCIPADHLDEMGQILGDSPGVGNAWDHLDFYTDLLAWLRTEGY